MRRKHKKFIDPRYFMEEKLEENRPPFKGGYQHEEPDNSEVKPTPGGYQKEEPQQFSGDVKDVAAAQEKIEGVLNALYDTGVDNDGLKALLQNIIKDIDSGFVGEPT